MVELRFHRAARIELIEAINYYKEQRPGYGDKFVAEVEKVTERIVELPGSGAPCSGGIHPSSTSMLIDCGYSRTR